eukprot:17234-Eustigmatos_ZCMA.PRE.1
MLFPLRRHKPDRISDDSTSTEREICRTIRASSTTSDTRFNPMVSSPCSDSSSSIGRTCLTNADLSYALDKPTVAGYAR